VMKICPSPVVLLSATLKTIARPDVAIALGILAGTTTPPGSSQPAVRCDVSQVFCDGPIFRSTPRLTALRVPRGSAVSSTPEGLFGGGASTPGARIREAFE